MARGAITLYDAKQPNQLCLYRCFKCAKLICCAIISYSTNKSARIHAHMHAKYDGADLTCRKSSHINRNTVPARIRWNYNKCDGDRINALQINESEQHMPSTLFSVPNINRVSMKIELRARERELRQCRKCLKQRYIIRSLHHEPTLIHIHTKNWARDVRATHTKQTPIHWNRIVEPSSLCEHTWFVNSKQPCCAHGDAIVFSLGRPVDCSNGNYAFVQRMHGVCRVHTVF